jgi:hypothetical protein
LSNKLIYFRLFYIRAYEFIKKDFAFSKCVTCHPISMFDENSKVRMYVNGIRISITAYGYTNCDTTSTYNLANNWGYVLTVGDRTQFDYCHEKQDFR